MKDFLGKDWAVGDTILYGAASGRSAITMVIARVDKIRLNEDGTTKSVTVTPLKSSRWKQHYGRTRWIDTRTGKNVDPDYHIKKKAHYIDKITRQEIPRKDFWDLANYIEQHYGRENRFDTYKYLEYVPDEYNDYIQEGETVKSATLTVTDNIVRWDGELPE
jgi:hypothetical protein